MLIALHVEFSGTCFSLCQVIGSEDVYFTDLNLDYWLWRYMNGVTSNPAK